eukprot:TRINITY_DN55839_c0_g1_i1.p2 TRINITY_DN55839_c0_g1~~TRINITY_DN55839_c0_g1_i1.p2  ORF type:complete len:507 (+),score=158.36 TRINITY_DN55839_c0_g1_i1:101-1522(+)
MFAPPLQSGRETIGGDNTVLRGIAESDARVERMRRAQRAKMVQRELAEEDAFLNQCRAAAQKQKAVDRAEALAAHIEAEKTQTLRVQRTTQRVKEETPELRQLERAIQLAYVNKSRAAQVADRKAEAEIQKEKEKEEAAALEKARLEDLAAHEEAERQRLERSRMSAAELAEQERLKEQRRLEAYKEFLREKQLVSDVVARVAAEDARDAEMRRDKAQQAKRYVDEFKEQRAATVRAERDKELDEDRRIREYMAMQSQRAEETQRKAQAKLDEQNRILQSQAEKIAADRREREERERLLNEYYTERREEALRADEEARKQRQIEGKLEMRRYAELQRRILAARRQQEKEEEEETRRRLMDQFREEEERERASAAMRARRRAQYAREIDELLDQKRRVRAAEEQRRQAEEMQSLDAEERRSDVVRAERLRLLREHGIPLLGYLPKGTITPEDLRDLGLTPQQVREIEAQMTRQG